MATLDVSRRLRRVLQNAVGQGKRDAAITAISVAREPRLAAPAEIDVAPNDPIVGYFQSAAGPVEIENVRLDSPALQRMRQVGIVLAVPLVSQGELVGLLGLGARLSEQGYSADDRALLANLASQAAPAVRVAQLVRQHQAEALARERIEAELRFAHEIQQTLLPKELPTLPGWQVAALYRPAREVGAHVDLGERLLLYSDGLVEAHAPNGAMFGFPKLEQLLALPIQGELIEFLVNQLGAFVGQEWEQEDDVTMVTLSRSATEGH
jgi:GAF domain-containing protein